MLGELVEIESASDDPAGLAVMGARLEELMGELGEVARHRAGSATVNHLLVTVDGVESGQLPPAVVLGHYDTVWPRGTIERIPAPIRSP